MRIKELKILGHYRNLAHQCIRFPESNFLALVGANGSGKTSILDIISVISMDIQDESFCFEGVYEDSNGDTFLMNTKDIQNKNIPVTYFESDRFIGESLIYYFKSKDSLNKFINISKEFFSGLNKKLVNVELDSSIQFIFSNSRLSLNRLGEGCRIFLSMISDLLMVEESLKEETSIILIDELEIHLHPSLHRIVVKILKKYFSELQIIVTTNSPMVISELPKEEVRLIDPKDSEIINCEYHTYGADSNRLLNVVFDTDERPNEVKKLFEEFSYKIASRDFDKAKEILSRLKDLVGELDSEIISCQVTLDLEQLDEKCFGDKHKRISFRQEL